SAGAPTRELGVILSTTNRPPFWPVMPASWWSLMGLSAALALPASNRPSTMPKPSARSRERLEPEHIGPPDETHLGFGILGRRIAEVVTQEAGAAGRLVEAASRYGAISS